jgi:hypothetical protein
MNKNREKWTARMPLPLFAYFATFAVHKNVTAELTLLHFSSAWGLLFHICSHPKLQFERIAGSRQKGTAK